MPDGQWLFSYGTLRDPIVQRALFGRAVEESDDTLVGFVLDTVIITDPATIATSGSDRHPILRRGSGSHEVRGAVLLLTDAELAAVDRYEAQDYARISTLLASGRRAYVYVHRSEAFA
ncbi:MAG: gamma-glutamylcyclotransferase [Pseudomonadota bacterium]|nr:gamma-glutamylcyclotransferase [Pseudomonadota bacterium]